MIYGLIGASGSGKTTLAHQAAEAMNLAFLPTSITKSAERHGFNAVGELSLHDRINLQHHLLDDMVELITKADRPAILDRTPVDMIAYMLCEVDMHSHKRVSDKDLERVESYVDACLETTSTYFAHVFFLNRLDFVVYDDKPRPPVNPGYSLHTEIVMRGALALLDGKVGISMVETSDFNTRLDHVTSYIAGNLDYHERTRASSRVH
jgi:predicted ATPase